MLQRLYLPTTVWKRAPTVPGLVADIYQVVHSNQLISRKNANSFKTAGTWSAKI